jgi:hypothetical protein
MPPSSSQANRAALLLAIVLVGLALLLLLGKSRRGPNGSQTAQARSGSSAAGTFPSGGKNEVFPTKRQREEIRMRAESNPLARCCESVVHRLKEDEAARAKMIFKGETADSYLYRIAISPGEEMDARVDEWIDQEATQAKLDPAAVRETFWTEDFLPKNYSIRQGYGMMVQLFIPKDRAQMPSSISVEVLAEECSAPGDQVDFIYGRNLLSARPEPGEKNWRYDHLLKLDGVAQK